MRELFVITIAINEENPSEGRSFFTESGEPVGRVVDVRKNTIKPQEPFCSYDVETSEDMYRKLSDGSAKLYGIEEYTVSKSYTHYIAN